MHSIFAINESRDIFFEKHWRNVITKSICDYFFEIQSKSPTTNSVPVIIKAHQYNLIHVYRFNIYLVAVCSNNVLPMLIVELLHKVFDVIYDYFQDVSEAVFKENMVLIYEILSEMIEGGLPFMTEPNALKEIIKAPNFLRTIANSISTSSNISDTLYRSQPSNTPWRQNNVHHTNNEAFFDVYEYLSATIDKNGILIFSEITGKINCHVQLSGMPTLNMTFENPKLFDDISFHRCVKVLNWENEKAVRFVPPDGFFQLLSYKVRSYSSCTVPISVRHNLCMTTNELGRLEVTVSPKLMFDRTIEDIQLEIILPKNIINCNLESNDGNFTFDSVKKILLWNIGKLECTKSAKITGTVSFDQKLTTSITKNRTENRDSTQISFAIHVKFAINQFALSGVKVNRLDMLHEKYKPFKGVKYITKTGNFFIRT